MYFEQTIVKSAKTGVGVFRMDVSSRRHRHGDNKIRAMLIVIINAYLHPFTASVNDVRAREQHV